MRSASRGVLLRMYRRALRRKEWLVSHDRDEAVDALQHLMSDERARRGRLAALALWARAMLDAATVSARLPAPFRRLGDHASWAGDLRHSVRALRRRPGYAIGVTLTLALGVSGVSAAFTLADPMLFTPLPFPDPDRIVSVTVRTERTFYPNVADFIAIRDHAQTVELVSTTGVDTGGYLDGLPDELHGVSVSRNFLELFGQTPTIGRVFLPDEFASARDTRPSVCMITWGVWQRAFGGRADVVGRLLELENTSGGVRCQIVGVLRPDFVYPNTVNQAPSILFPRGPNIAFAGNPNAGTGTYARLKRGVTVEAAAAEIDGLLRSVAADYPTLPAERAAVLRPMADVLFRSVRTPLTLLVVATLAMLLLASVNAAHLTLASWSARAREVAVRQALGGGTWRVVRLVVTEACVLALVGGALGVFFGQVLFHQVIEQAPRLVHVYRLMPAGLTPRGLTLAGVLTLGAIGILVAAPAWRIARVKTGAVLNTAHQVGPRRRRVATVAVATSQAMFTVAVVVITALVVRSYYRAAFADRGFDPAGMQVIGITIPDQVDSSERARQRRYLAMASIVRQMPGIVAVDLAASIPSMTVGGVLQQPVVDADASPVRYHRVGASFVTAAGMRLIQGRLLEAWEAEGGEPVALIDRAGAEQLWPGQPALGKQVRDAGGRAYTVVGILDTVRTGYSSEQPPVALLPLDPSDTRGFLLVARFTRLGGPSRDELAAALQRLEPRARVSYLGPNATFERFIGQSRFLAWVLAVMGALTVLLAATGVFALAAHSVLDRTREIGLRMALGADRRRLRAMVVRQALMPALPGVAAGLLIALWWARSLDAVLLGLAPTDVASYTTAGLGTVAVIIAGAAIPALRASRLDPAITLRAE